MTEPHDPLSLQQQVQYRRESEALICQTILVKPKSSSESVSWKVLSSVSSQESPCLKEFA